MALVICPECGKQISDKAVFCINCGCPMTFIVNQLKTNQEQKPIQAIKSNKLPDSTATKIKPNWETEIQNLQNEKSIDEDEEDLFDEDRLNWDDERKYLPKEKSIYANESFDEQEYNEYLQELSSQADDMKRLDETGWLYSDSDED